MEATTSNLHFKKKKKKHREKKCTDDTSYIGEALLREEIRKSKKKKRKLKADKPLLEDEIRSDGETQQGNSSHLPTKRKKNKEQAKNRFGLQEQLKDFPEKVKKNKKRRRKERQAEIREEITPEKLYPNANVQRDKKRRKKDGSVQLPNEAVIPEEQSEPCAFIVNDFYSSMSNKVSPCRSETIAYPDGSIQKKRKKRKQLFHSDSNSHQLFTRIKKARVQSIDPLLIEKPETDPVESDFSSPEPDLPSSVGASEMDTTFDNPVVETDGFDIGDMDDASDSDERTSIRTPETQQIAPPENTRDLKSLIRTEKELKEEDTRAAENTNLQKDFMRCRFKIPVIDPQKRPVPFKVINWILDHDFPIPRIQFMFYHTFGIPSAAEKLRMLKHNPNYSSGRFEQHEDDVIVRRLKTLIRENKLSSREGWRLIKEISRFGCKTGHRHYSRLILAAFIGRPLLEYRRLNDVYLRLLKLVQLSRSEEDDTDTKVEMIDWLETNGPNYSLCRKVFKMELRMSTAQLRHLHCMHQRSQKPQLLTGKFTLEEDEHLLYLVMKHSECLSLTKVDWKVLNWKDFGEEMRRSAVSLVRHWERNVWPVLAKYLGGEEYISTRAFKIKLLKLVQTQGIELRKHVNYTLLLQSFPYETTLSLREALSAATSRGPRDASFKEKIRLGLDYLMENDKNDKKYEAATIKLVAVYEAVKSRLKKEL